MFCVPLSRRVPEPKIEKWNLNFLHNKWRSHRRCADIYAVCTVGKHEKQFLQNIHRLRSVRAVTEHLWCIASINCFHLLAFIKTWIRFLFHQNDSSLSLSLSLPTVGKRLLFFKFWCFANFLCTQKWAFDLFRVSQEFSFRSWTRSLHDSKMQWDSSNFFGCQSWKQLKWKWINHGCCY